MSFFEAVFILLCFTLSFHHACNGLVLGSESVMVSIVSDLQHPETASSLKTISMLTSGHPIASRKIIASGYEKRIVSAENVKSSTEERILQEQNAANDSEITVEDVVVMDYAQPHRKPPIHNEEN